jgi:hypothetical protein
VRRVVRTMAVRAAPSASPHAPPPHRAPSAKAEPSLFEAGGMTAAERQHEPLEITRVVSRSSVPLLKTLANHEMREC